MAELPAIERAMARVNYERRNLGKQGDEFKLDTIRYLLDQLGNPQNELTIVHIAGTKGKGSTAQFVSQIGAELGLKTGIYSSPHFERYSERFRINNREVDAATLNPILERVLQVAEQLDLRIENNDSDLQPATFFDISTAVAFALFAQQRVELVALEVGLGGRLDSTNICQAEVSVITNISLDHTRQLGSTTPEIAAEKAGIIKSQAPVVCGPVDESIFAVIHRAAQKQGAKILRSGFDFKSEVNPSNASEPESGNIDQGFPSLRFDYENDQWQISGIELPGWGVHQADNAGLAITALLQLRHRLGYFSEEDFEKAVRKGIRQTKLTGRLEVICESPLLVIDMAHNQASIQAMITSLRQRRLQGKKQVLFSCSRDKDWEAMLLEMRDYFDRFIFTEFKNNPRYCPADQVARSFANLLGTPTENVENLKTTWEIQTDPRQALLSAMDPRDDFGLTVVCGSIFLVGELMPTFRERLSAPC